MSVASNQLEKRRISKKIKEPRLCSGEVPNRFGRRTELARKIFDKAIEEEYIIINDDHYEWTLNKVLLAYMCGRIYCEDYPEKTIYDEKMYWMPGRVELFPGAELDKLFNMKDLTQSRHSRKNKAAPIGSEKIDKLFE